MSAVERAAQVLGQHEAAAGPLRACSCGAPIAGHNHQARRLTHRGHVAQALADVVAKEQR